jgi:hypothetical protein
MAVTKMDIPTGPSKILSSSRGAKKAGGSKPATKPTGLSCSPGMKMGGMRKR